MRTKSGVIFLLTLPKSQLRCKSSRYLMAPLRQKAWASASILANYKIKTLNTSDQNARLARINFNKCYKRYQHQISLSRMNIPHKDAVQDILSKYKIPYDKGHATIIANCPNSCKLADSNEKCVYINKVTGSFVCKRCEKRGQWQETKDWYSGKKGFVHEQKAVANQTEDIVAEWENCNRFEECDDEIKTQLVKKYSIQGLQEDYIKKYKLRVKKLKLLSSNEEQYYLLCPWFDFSNIICGIKVLLPERTDVPSLETIPKTSTFGLFGYENMKKEDSEVALTANEFDAIAINQATGMPAVSLPNGNVHLPVDLVPLFEQFKRITIWLGNSVKDKRMELQFANKLKRERCYFLPSALKGEFPTATEALNQGLDLKRVIDSAHAVAHNRIVSFNDLRQDVYNEFANREQISGVKWQRHPELTNILKGHRRGELTVFTGPTGSGKTTFISEMSIDLCHQGVNTLFGSFEIRNVRIMKTMLKQFSGINFENKDNLTDFDKYATQFEKLPMYFMHFYGAQDIKHVIQTMEHAAYIFDIEHIIVDNLQFLLNADTSRDEFPFRQQNLALSKFRRFATEKNVHVTLVIHPRKENDDADLQMASIGGSAKASQEADNVMILQNIKYKGKSIQVVKNRFDGDLGSYKIMFSKENLCMGSQSHKYTAKALETSATSEDVPAQASKKTPKKPPKSLQVKKLKLTGKAS